MPFRVPTSRVSEPSEDREGDGKLRGAFLNTEPAVCSIFESGRMVYDCLKEASEYTLDYITLDEVDREHFGRHAKFRLNQSPNRTYDAPVDYDFWILNYHPATMAPHLPPEWLRHLPGKKFAIVLEVEPDDPIKHVRGAEFDNHIVLDPTASRTARVTAFPRPLNGGPRQARPLSRGVPVIGSFGMGTPGKGFEHLVEAVNHEFDEAIVRINVPVSTYADDAMFNVHRMPYADHLEALCKSVAKPGIEVQFSRRFMDSDELVDWCAENDLNCFFYTRRQSGLSATTDQCVLSGQPLLVTSNDTFRHIHKYIRPYPRMGLREAMTVTRPAVAQMQLDWSPKNFQSIFVDLLERSDLLSSPAVALGNSARAAPSASRELPLIAFVVPPDAELGDAVHYFQRAIDAVSRTGEFRVVCYREHQLAELTDFLFWRSPAAIVICTTPTGRVPYCAALKSYRGRLFMLPQGLDQPGESVLEEFADLLGRKPEVLPRQPIIPYYTALPSVPQGGGVRICVFGFRNPSSRLEQLIAKIQRDDDQAHIDIVRTRDEEDLDEALFIERVRHLDSQLKLTPVVHFQVVDVERNAHQLIHWIGSHHVCIIANDTRYTEELMTIAEMALTTERAVAFTRTAPFPGFDQGVLIEDTFIKSLARQASAAQSGLYNAYSEGRFADGFLSRLADVPEARGAMGRGATVGGGDLADGQPWAGIIDEDLAAWLIRAYEGASPKLEDGDLTRLQAAYVDGQQAFLIAAVEMLSRRTNGSRVLFAGDASRRSVASLIERNYDVAPLWGDAGGPGSAPACVFNSCAVSGLDEAERFLRTSNEVLLPGGAGALTFFVRESFAAEDPRENPDFPVIDPQDLVSLLSRFGLSLIGQPDWSLRRPTFTPSQEKPPPLGTLLFQKPVRSANGIAP